LIPALISFNSWAEEKEEGMKNLEIETLERMYSAENVFERYSAKLMERS